MYVYECMCRDTAHTQVCVVIFLHTHIYDDMDSWIYVCIRGVMYEICGCMCEHAVHTSVYKRIAFSSILSEL